MKRKLSSLAMMGLMGLSLASCGGKQTLLFLNWGEYIDETLIDAFEEKYNCNVYMDLGDSNEIFYSKVRGGTTVYDVVCPSDYMVEKMYMNNMLEEIDPSKLPLSGFTPKSDNARAGVKSIFNDMDVNLKANYAGYVSGDIYNYAVPYLWGTWGIMYNTELEGLEKAITSSTNQWSCLYDRKSLPAGTRVAMYDSHQHAYYTACKYLGLDSTVELAASDLAKIQTLVKTMNYDAWGTDNIKKDIVAGNIDVGFMWTGDFLYYYAENAANVAMDAYLAGDVTVTDVNKLLNEITDSSDRVYTVGKKDYQIGFDIFIPDDTVAFCDNLVITKDSSNKDLAYKFVDFMAAYSTSSALNDNGEEDSNSDELNPSFTNTYYVDYDAVRIDVYDDLVALKETVFTADDASLFKEEVADGTDSYDTTLYWMFYDYAIGVGFEKYYPRDEAKGTILATFQRSYVNTINTTYNNARA